MPQIGTVFSGPSTADPAATHLDPAMMTGLERPELLLDVGLVAGRVGYRRDRLGSYQREDGLAYRDPVDPADLDPSKTGSADPVAAHPVAPWAGLFVAGPVYEDRLFLGGGVAVPYAAPLKFPAEGAQRFQLQQAFVAVTHVDLSLAAKLHDTVRIGAGVSYVLGTASLARRQDFAGVDLLADALANPPIGQPNSLGSSAPSTVRELDVFERPFAFRNGIAHGVTFRAGLAIVPVDRVTIAASYEHGTRLDFHGTFQLDLDDPFFRSDLKANGLSYPRRVDGEGVLGVHLPSRLRVGVGVDATKDVRLDLLGEWVRWSQLRSFDLTLTSPDLAQPALGLPDTTSVALDRSWKDSAHLAFRGTVRASETAQVAAMVGWQSPASPDRTVDVASPDGQRLLGSLGAGFDLKPRIRLIVDANVQGILPRTVTTSAYDLGNGRYDLVLASVALHLQTGLDRAKPRRTK